MKKILLAAALMALLTTTPAEAQTMQNSGMQQGMMDTQQRQQSALHHGQADSQQQVDGVQNMMGGGQGLVSHPGMMPCMMGGGQGLMSYSGMMRAGMMQRLGAADLEKYENFVNETREMRRKLHNLQFEYGEALWNPATTLGDLRKMVAEMEQLRNAIQKKMTQ